MNSLAVAALLSTSIFAGTISAPSTSKHKEKKMPTEWSGSTGGGKADAQLIFSDDQWAELWKRLGRPAPPAELKGRIAAFVALGERPTGGYGVAWLPPVETKDAAVVRWKEKVPAEDAMVMQMITDPWSVKLFPKTAKAVHLEKEAAAK